MSTVGCRSVSQTPMPHRGRGSFGGNHAGGGVFSRPMVKSVPLAGQSLVSVPTKETTIGGEYDSLVAVSSQSQTVGRLSPSMRRKVTIPECVPLMTINGGSGGSNQTQKSPNGVDSLLRRDKDISLNKPE